MRDITKLTAKEADAFRGVSLKEVDRALEIL